MKYSRFNYFLMLLCFALLLCFASGFAYKFHYPDAAKILSRVGMVIIFTSGLFLYTGRKEP